MDGMPPQYPISLLHPAAGLAGDDGGDHAGHKMATQRETMRVTGATACVLQNPGSGGQCDVSRASDPLMAGFTSVIFVTQIVGILTPARDAHFNVQTGWNFITILDVPVYGSFSKRSYYAWLYRVNAVSESFFHTLKTELIHHQI
jgi:hypothetical protein